MEKYRLDPFDAEELRQLKARYFRFIDTKRWTELRSLFTEDCRFEGLWATANSPEKFVENVSTNFPQEVRSIHHGYMPELKLVGIDRVKAIWSMSDYLEWPIGTRNYLGVGVEDQRGIRGYGYYEDEYRRESGVWRISYLRLSRLHIEPIIGTAPMTAGYPVAVHDPDWLA
jgi:hypothetical protein